MADTVISPNMNLPVPVVGVDPGPDWANNINACMAAIDSHNHSTNQGVPITPSGIDINADLPMNGHNLADANSVGYSTLSAADTALLRTNQVVDEDLYFIDGAGNSVRITQGGSVTGASGTITGLPSGTASASFSGGTFTFQSATNTPATMDIGPAIIRSTTASSFGVTLSSQAAQAANYNVFFPLVAPAANQLPVADGSGNLSWSFGLMPIGSVIATFPNLTGAYSSSGTTSADAYGFVRCIGQTISDVTSPMNGQVVPNINNSVFLSGSTTAGTTGGSATSNGVGAHTHTLTGGSAFPTGTHTHGMSHTHQWCFYDATVAFGMYAVNSSDPTSTTGAITSSNFNFATIPSSTNVEIGTAVRALVRGSVSNTNFFTTGVVGSPSGSGGTAATATPSATDTLASTGTTFSILPPYISAVYLMRIK